MSRKNIRSARKIQAPKEVKNSMRVLNLSGYEIPSIKENTRNDWVEYGDNNDYFAELIERYLGSPTNSRCINGIVDMVRRTLEMIGLSTVTIMIISLNL